MTIKPDLIEFGELAKEKIRVNYNKTIYNSKMLMGVGGDEISYDTFFKHACPYRLVENNGKIKIQLNDRLWMRPK